MGSIGWLLALRRLVTPVAYIVGLVLSLWCAYLIRFDFAVPVEHHRQFVVAACWIISLQLAFLLAAGQFSGHLMVFSLFDLSRLLLALVLSLASILILRAAHHGLSVPPRGIIVADCILALVVLGGWRCAVRLAWQRFRISRYRKTPCQRRVGIVGAGDVGSRLALDLLAKRHLGLKPVAFFDDSRHTWRSSIHGVPVVGSPDLLSPRHADAPDEKSTCFARLFRRTNGRKPERLHLDEVIIAMPSAPARRVREVVKVLQGAGVPFRTVPSLDQLVTGAVEVNQLRKVQIDDLLGRSPVSIETNQIRTLLEGKVVMVTGAGGSIGSELCRQIIAFGPEKLLMVEQSEVQMFQLEQALLALPFNGVLLPCIADVLDHARMDHLFGMHHPQAVFHAAAHKHVPLMESQPGEAIKNNLFGTANVARLAVKHQVERFVLISTDKAINPTNVMGATKRLAEMVVQSWHGNAPGSTKLMGVRFGNVLGSSGSVIPTFSRQIAEGGPVKVTHPEITRYFMTIPEAVNLVLQSFAQGQGGEIFVLDMGKPVRIRDLAVEMIRLSGLTPGEDIEIEFVGLRPGEKLYEELCANTENTAPTHHPKVMRFVSPLPDRSDVERALACLADGVGRLSPNELKCLLQRMVPEYRPYFPPGPSSDGLAGA
ncbi:MAG TPA: nucleoside-diphosphate sugar epimerase/dehydratase [Chthoniobacteraceae bacterium]|nr:nucleoside-diphosphate sugar epimerase/dehydratase [Chthoniobacteraceae bacterium]